MSKDLLCTRGHGVTDSDVSGTPGGGADSHGQLGAARARVAAAGVGRQLRQVTDRWTRRPRRSPFPTPPAPVHTPNIAPTLPRVRTSRSSVRRPAVTPRLAAARCRAGSVGPLWRRTPAPDVNKHAAPRLLQTAARCPVDLTLKAGTT